MINNNKLFEEFEENRQAQTNALFNHTKRRREERRNKDLRNLESFGVKL